MRRGVYGDGRNENEEKQGLESSSGKFSVSEQLKSSYVTRRVCK